MAQGMCPPFPNFVFSQDSSPSVLFSNLSTPAMNIDFATGLNVAGFTNGISGAPELIDHHRPPPFADPLAQPRFPISQRPPFADLPPCQLYIDKIPLKSRVETQIPHQDEDISATLWLQTTSPSHPHHL